MRRMRAGRSMGVVLLAAGMVTAVGLGGGLEEWSSDGVYAYSSAIVVQNVSDTVAVVNISYPASNAASASETSVTVPAGKRQTITMNEVTQAPWRAAAVVSSDQPVVAIQSFLWKDPAIGNQWAANTGGVRAPSTTWYLAEGSTYGGFESTISIQNPGGQPADVNVTYMTPGGSHDGPSLTLEPMTQTQIDVADSLVDWSSISAVVTASSPVVAQLSVYWNEGTSTKSVMGVPSPATTWYLPEANTASWSRYETWIVVQNPRSAPANVTVSYLGQGNKIDGPGFQVPPMTHWTVNVADTFPDQTGFGAVIVSDVPVVAAQSMRWDDHRGFDTSMGSATPAQTWFLPEARACGGQMTWLRVQNAGEAPADVTVTYAGQDGETAGPTLTLDPFQSEAISLPEGVGYSVIVRSDGPILAEQGAYWETSYGVHRCQRFGAPQASTTWYLPWTPRYPQSADSSSLPDTGSDRDADGVPDDQDYCPDFPGSPQTNGC